MSKESSLQALSLRALSAMTADTDSTPPQAPVSLSDRESIVTKWQSWAKLNPDGWPGTATLSALWQRHQPTPAEIAATAMLATQWPKVEYTLGTGGNTFLPDPQTPLSECDCSGFSAHCLGLSRNVGWLNAKMKWIETTQVFADAKGQQALFVAHPLRSAKVGDLVVYPDEGGKQGHMGVVVEVVDGQILTVDCSATSESIGNKSAIQKRDRTTLWQNKGAIVARPIWNDGSRRGAGVVGFSLVLMALIAFVLVKRR